MTIRTRNIGDSAVTNAKLKASSITGASIADAAIEASEILNGAVDGEHLATTLKTGYIPLNIFNMRIIATNAYLNTIEAGVPDGNTDPLIQRLDSATDGAGRMSWAAHAVTGIIEMSFPVFVLPPDIDSSQPLYVKLRASMAGATNTPTIAVSYFEGVGDTNAGSATGAVTGTTPATYTVTIAAADVGAAGAPVTIGLTPGAHTTDILRLDAAWVEYTRA